MRNNCKRCGNAPPKPGDPSRIWCAKGLSFTSVQEPAPAGRCKFGGQSQPSASALYSTVTTPTTPLPVRYGRSYWSEGEIWKWQYFYRIVWGRPRIDRHFREQGFETIP